MYDGMVYWLEGGMGLKVFKAEMQGNHRSLYYRFEFLVSPVPTDDELIILHNTMLRRPAANDTET